MSNTSKGRAYKGSKFWMQVAVEYPKMKKEIDRIIGDELDWISPLEKDEFAEYKLNQQKMKELLGISNNEAKDLFKDWPQGQPQWDGIAIGKEKRTLYLVEAKAHTREMETSCSASVNSKGRIIEALSKSFKNYSGSDFDIWTNKYYQLANRLYFLDVMKKSESKCFDEVKLVLLNFVDDKWYKPTSLEVWKQYYAGVVWPKMIGQKTAPKDVIEAYLKVSYQGVALNPKTGKLLCKWKQWMCTLCKWKQWMCTLWSGWRYKRNEKRN